MLFISDYHLHYFDKLHNKLSFITLSLSYAINLPLDLIKKANVNLIDKTILLKENAHLTAKLLSANTRLQRLDFLEHENTELRILLGSSHKIKYRTLAAETIKLEGDYFNQRVTINKGKNNDVYNRQPVVDAYGLLGQVVAVGKNASKVLLITSNKSAVPVMVVRNGIQTIALGRGINAHLELAHLPKTADIQIGDMIVTSGLGGHFPAGYKVGVIGEIKYVIGECFTKVSIIPAAHINMANHVLLIWPDSITVRKSSTNQ